MPVSIQKARSLCTKSELDLLHWSRSPDLVDLPPSRIKQKIARSRKLRDKFRDLADRQRRESRRKEGPRGKRPSESNDATRTKQQLFQEALERFEAALVKHNAAVAKKASKKKTSKKTTKKISKKTLMKKASKASAKPAKKVSKKTASLASALQAEQKAWNKSARAVSSQSAGKRTSMKFSRTGQPKIQGHVSSRTRRNQAKRDARG